MAYFDCTIGSAGEFSIPLVVTCTANFAGQTITCSDGTTTLTGTCPSASPYEVIFELPNTGTWTVSGTISGYTYSDSVLINEFDVELTDEIDITVDVYSAASDTISYVGIDGQTHTITTDSNGHASATITINGNGSSLTFTSSVAKDPSNLSNDYTKIISLNPSTTNIYVCPDGALYWYGNERKTFTNTSLSLTKNTNSVSLTLNPTTSVTTGNYKTSESQTVSGKTIKSIVNSASLGAYSASQSIGIVLGSTRIKEFVRASAITTPTLVTASASSNGELGFDFLSNPIGSGSYPLKLTFAALWFE